MASATFEVSVRDLPEVVEEMRQLRDLRVLVIDERDAYYRELLRMQDRVGALEDRLRALGQSVD